MKRFLQSASIAVILDKEQLSNSAGERQAVNERDNIHESNEARKDPGDLQLHRRYEMTACPERGRLFI